MLFGCKLLIFHNIFIKCQLKNAQVYHLLIRYDFFEPWVKSDFTITEQKLTGRFFEGHVKLLYFKWGYGVSQLEYSS